MLTSTASKAVLFFRLGCAVACLGVTIGAFGAHALTDTLKANNMTTVYETGVAYQMYHAPPLLAIAWLLTLRGSAADARVLSIAGKLYTFCVAHLHGYLHALAMMRFTICTSLGGTARCSLRSVLRDI